MAKAQKVTADMNSEELDQLRRNFNTLLILLENTAASVTAGDTAEVVLQALGEGIAAGVDSDPNTRLSSGVATGRKIVGVYPTPLHPNRPKHVTLKDMDSGSEF